MRMIRQRRCRPGHPLADWYRAVRHKISFVRPVFAAAERAAVDEFRGAAEVLVFAVRVRPTLDGPVLNQRAGA
jgi:hypothetical protein